MFKKLNCLLVSLFCVSAILCSQESRRAYAELLKKDADLQEMLELFTGRKTSKRDRKKLYKLIIRQMEAQQYGKWKHSK